MLATSINAVHRIPKSCRCRRLIQTITDVLHENADQIRSISSSLFSARPEPTQPEPEPEPEPNSSCSLSEREFLDELRCLGVEQYV